MDRAPDDNSTNCAADLAAGFNLIGKQQLGEPLSETIARNEEVARLGQSCVNNAQNPHFCEAHCVPSFCPARTVETIVQLNSQILTTGGTEAKKQVLAELKRAGDLIEEQSGSQCPFLKDPNLFTPMAEELARGLSLEVIRDLGLDPFDETLASDMDPEAVLRMANLI
jgi:hypothetical protein